VAVVVGAALLHTGAGLDAAEAAAAMGLFVAGELTGRVAGGRLTRRPGRARALVLGALTVTAGGFALLWLADRPLVALVGLTATGLGVANLYPIGLALALAAAPGRTDQAAGRTQLPVGAAVGLAPFALGALADAVGVRGAFAVEPVLLALALALLAAGSYSSRRS
jgi:fucose permease